MVRKVRLSSIFEARPQFQETEPEAPATGSAPDAITPDELSLRTTIRWGMLAQQLNENDQEAAWAFIICRARRIWGRLGNKLQRSKRCLRFRMEFFVPVRVLQYVRKWIPRGRSY